VVETATPSAQNENNVHMFFFNSCIDITVLFTIPGFRKKYVWILCIHFFTHLFLLTASCSLILLSRELNALILYQDM
jgi:hypothetical protein